MKSHIFSRPKTLPPLHMIFMVMGGCILLFIVGPLVSMILHTGAGEMMEAVADPEVTGSIWLTIWTSMTGAVFFSIFAIPFAYILARREFPFKRLVVAIIDLPIVVPHTAAGIAMLGVLSRNSLLGSTAGNFGIELIGSPIGIMAAMSFVSIPFLINSARDGFVNVPERLEKAALNLGASQFRVFVTISLPLAWRSVLSGIILMWARGLSEFGAVVVVAYHPMITPILIYERFSSFGLKYARPVTVVFLMVCLFVFILLRLMAGGKKNAQT